MGHRDERIRVVTDGTPHGEPIGVAYEDGTILDTPSVSGPKRRRRRRSRMAFVMIEQDAALKAPKALPPNDIRVLNALLAEYNADTQVSRLTASEIAFALGMAPSNVHRSLKNLVEKRFLRRLGPGAWVVNPHYGFRGDTEVWRELVDDWEEPEW